MTRLAFGVVVVLTIVAATTACGSPDSGADFDFDPEPVTVLPGGTAVAIGASGQPHFAGQIVVVAKLASVDKLVDWFASYGFKLLDRQDEPRTGTSVMLVGVPTGSVPVASRIILKQPGVIDAGPNGWIVIPDCRIGPG